MKQKTSAEPDAHSNKPVTPAPRPSGLNRLDAYRDFPAAQQPDWPDPAELHAAVRKLESKPPLVFAGEADVLTRRLAQAQAGKAFVLQGGDCAEIFADAKADRIRSKIQTVLQMAVVLTYGASLPVVKIGRMAGQYAKPRSASTETRDGVTLPVYRGDAVNEFEFTEKARRNNPWRMVEAYDHSSSTLNLIRAFTMGGFADLRHVHEWNQGFRENPAYSRYNAVATQIDKAIKFMEACGADFDALKRVEFFSSHEALLLDYERALTRSDSRSGGAVAYDCSAHFLWIGDRSSKPEGAHAELLSNVRNPLGVKVGPKAHVTDVMRLIEKLNPLHEPGRLTLITRMGADAVRVLLPGLVRAVRAANQPVLWVCDPMHGNTFTTPSGVKTRRFDTIINEVKGFFEVLRYEGEVPGGLHVELTGDDVTEVMGGSEDIDDEALSRRYETLVDPRLNHQQALEMAFQVAELLGQ
ncbi:MAG: 3-deoxy-7-phosphoheptulonate synthase class II [Bifidobacteriaceae bacterium]|jgi:3-deoxy-7-phosphoheptulonate synthase|nr:3-deoxy-7-phosphoheptulonate synthase class II [Bifidobacteriaceae bacterium]